MRKLFTLLVTIFMTITLLGNEYVSPQEGLGYCITHKVEPYTVEVCWADENLVEVYLPTTVVIDGISYAVTGIGYNAFADCSSLTSITIPNSILYIEGTPFSGCSSLTSVSINSNAVVGIGYDSYYNIKDIFGKQVIEYIIGDSVTQVGSYAFYNCSSLTSITIGSGVKSIEDHAFDGCSLSSVTIPNNVTTLGEFAFDDCSSLSSVIIGSGVKSIGDYTFSDCSSLTSITIPNSVTSIGEGAFSRCSALTSIAVESNNSKYDSRENCNAIIETATNTLLAGCQNTIIPNSVTSIGSLAFADCFSLSSITIPNNVTTIGNSAFESCSSLASITIPNNVTTLGEFAFVSCDSLSSVIIGNGVTSIGSSAFAGCSALSSVTIPNNVTTLGDFAFSNCSSLSSVIIGSGVKSIGDYTFSNCSSLTSITIPNSVTSIGKYTFCDCPSLTSVVIGSGVKTIGEYAFYGCSSLTSINFPIRLTSIGSKAFYNCSSLSSIIIPNRVKNIGEGAFYSCSSLNTVTCLAENPPALGTDGFYKCNYPTLLVPCESWAAYHDHEQWGTFVNIECLRSEIVETDEVIIESGTTTVTITWPTKENVDTYTIIIKQDGILFGTLNFNADGQLLNIAFAPGRNSNHPAQHAEKAGNGYRFTVTGLEEATTYAYNITAKDASDKTINSHSGEFTTQSNASTNVDNLNHSVESAQKLLRDGQLLILRDGKTYSVMGQEM